MSQAQFESAAADVRNLKAKPNNDELLKLYGLYKQGTVGDNDTAQPWAVQLEARAKWDAWTAQKGTSKEDAQKKYIAFVEELKGKY